MELQIDSCIQIGVSDEALLVIADAIWKNMEGKTVKEIKEIIAILEYRINENCHAVSI